MVKGLKGFILLQAACVRKLERVRKKIKQMNRGESPSSEDSSLEDLDEGGGDKSTGAIATKAEPPGDMKESDEVAVSKEEGKQDVVGEEVKTHVKQENGEKKDGAEPCDTMATMQAMRQKSTNYYTKHRDDEGTLVLKCRKCHNALSTTSHSWDVFCSAERR